ncbi:MAG: hypothetical protein Q9186_006201 [Xanthomendoza sp. 1 TL-2023]
MAATEKQLVDSALADTKYPERENTTKEDYTISSHSDDQNYAVKDKALLRKLDLKLLPALTLLYLLSFLDRSNAGNQYLTGLTLYFIGYVLFEVSASLLNSLGTK